MVYWRRESEDPKGLNIKYTCVTPIFQLEFWVKTESIGTTVYWSPLFVASILLLFKKTGIFFFFSFFSGERLLENPLKSTPVSNFDLLRASVHTLRKEPKSLHKLLSVQLT